MTRSVGAAVVAGVPAQARSGIPSACPTFTDPEGDQGVDQGGKGPRDTSPGAKALDLRTVAVGSTRDSLVVTIRVTDLSDREPVYLGHSYSVDFHTETTRYELTADLSSDGNDYTLASGPFDASGSGSLSTVGDISGTPEPSRNSLRMTVPLALLRRAGAEGWVTGLVATAGREIQTINGTGAQLGHTGGVLIEDTATTTHSYRIGTRGCL